MLRDLQIATICAALYEDQADGFWDHFWPIDGSYCALKRVPVDFVEAEPKTVDVVVWRGSTTNLDWLQDFGSELPIWDKELGHCAAGFLTGVRRIQKEVDAVVGQNLIITGHSLGAAHAAIYAAHRIAIEMPPLALVNFGEPRPGFERIPQLFAMANVPVRSYRNRQDPVTQVPTIPLIDGRDLYLHAAGTLIQLDAAPPADDSWGPLRDHHLSLYVEGIRQLAQVA